MCDSWFFSGPPYIPILGSLPFIPRKHIHLTISGSWLESYGPIVGLMLGSKPVIAVGGPREVIEVLRRDEFLGREEDDNVPDRNFHKRLGELCLHSRYDLSVWCKNFGERWYLIKITLMKKIR